MKLQVFFLVWHFVRVAGDVCSDSPGSCSSSPRASLMQTRSLNKQALSVVEASASRAQTLAGFQEYTSNIVAKYLKDGVSIDTEIETAIDTILTYIVAMLKELEAWHVFDKEKSDNCQSTAVNELCMTEYLADAIERDLESKLADVSTARDNHAACRLACSPANCSTQKCDDYNYYRKYGIPEDENAALFTENVACAVETPGKLSDPYIQADAGALEDTGSDLMLPKMESCLEDAKKWLDPLYLLYLKCKAVRDHCSPQDDGTSCITECNDKQSNLESKHCLYDTEQDIVCSDHKTCYTDKRDHCSDECPAIELRAQARAADDETGKRITCLLNVLKSAAEDKKDGLAACQAVVYPPYGPANQYFIACSIGFDEGSQNPTPPAACTAVASPCDEEYLTTEYTVLGLLPFGVPQTFDMHGPCNNCTHFGIAGR